MSRVIHFFNYLEYEDLENLQFKFDEPIKNSESGIYTSNLKEPIHFYLPKSEILENFEIRGRKNTIDLVKVYSYSIIANFLLSHALSKLINFERDCN